MSLPALFTYLVAHTALEALYLGAAGPRYKRMTDALQKRPGDRPLKYVYAALAYAIFFAATYYILIHAPFKSTKQALITGLAYGAAVYGVYNLTNIVLFKDYDVAIASLDIAYGILSCVAIAALGVYLRRRASVNFTHRP